MKNKVIKLGLGIAMVSLVLTGCQTKKPNKSVSNIETTQETTLDTTLLDTESAMLEVESGQEEDNDDEREEASITFYASEIEDKYWPSVERGIDKAKEELKLNSIQVIRDQNDFDGILLAESAKETRGFSFYLKDPQSKIQVLQESYKNGVPLIGINLEVNDQISGNLSANAVADAYAMGQLAATNTYAKLKDRISGLEEEQTVRLGIICENPDNPTIDARTQGYIDKMADLLGSSKTSVEGYDKYNRSAETPKYFIEVAVAATNIQEPVENPTGETPEGVDTENTDGQATSDESTDGTGAGLAEGTPVEAPKEDAIVILGDFDAESMRPRIAELLGKQDLITVFATSQAAAECMLEVNQETGRLNAEGVLGVGFDSGAVQMQAIREGVLSGAVAINYEQLGYKAITMAVSGALGQPLKDADTGALWYDTNNIDSEDLTAYLYE